MATKLQIRRDTAANWTSANPTLSAGEFGFETDTYKLKIGNGSTAWNSLNYYDDQFSGLDSADTIRLLGLGVVKHIIPAGNELYDLGDSDNRFRDLYLSGSTLKLGDATLTASNATLQLPATVQIGTTTLTSTSTQSISIGEDSDAGTILDSASVLQLINAAYIQANQITYNTNDFVDSAYVTTQINNLIDGAPGTLDTLNEIAAALNDDDSAYNTLLSLINAKTDYDSADTLGLIDSAYIQARQTTASSGVDSAAVTALIDSAYVQARQTSGGSGTVDSAQVVSIINNNTNSGFYKYKYTATAGQTVFADSDANGNIMSFDPNSTLVFYNGVLLDETTDYEASSNTVTLTSGADAGVSITVAKYGVGYVPPSFSWGGDRGVFAGGYSSTFHNVIDYIDITTAGNAIDFGDLTVARNGNHATASTTRSVFWGGWTGSVYTQTMDYITTATTGNATDFGDHSLGDGYYGANDGVISNGTTGLFGGGYDGSRVNSIHYLTIATTGNTTDFGDITAGRNTLGGSCDNTYGLFAGGDTNGSNKVNTIDYVTIATPSNATDFGDLTIARVDLMGGSDATRSVFCGGLSGGGASDRLTIDYVTTATPSNATDFGDLTGQRFDGGVSSNGTRACVVGYWASSTSNVIDYVTIQTAGNATDFGDTTTARSGLAGSSGTAS